MTLIVLYDKSIYTVSYGLEEVSCSILTCKKIHGDTSDPDITLGSMVPVVAKQLSGSLYISGPFMFPWTSESCG